MRNALGAAILVSFVVGLVLVWRDLQARHRPVQLRVTIIVLACLGPLGLVAIYLYAVDRRNHPRAE
ncbi:MAG: hypothetical protein ACT452_11020 [Microthrixaceae bacterium]